jgi:hypothetical protein
MVIRASEFTVFAPEDGKTHCIAVRNVTFLLPENEKRVKNIVLKAAYIRRI